MLHLSKTKHTLYKVARAFSSTQKYDTQICSHHTKKSHEGSYFVKLGCNTVIRLGLKMTWLQHQSDQILVIFQSLPLQNSYSTLLKTLMYFLTKCFQVEGIMKHIILPCTKSILKERLECKAILQLFG